MLTDTEIEAAFHLAVGGARVLTRRMVVHLADDAGMTPRGLVLHLERRDLAPAGSWDWFAANGGITQEQVAEIRADRRNAERDTPDA